MMRAKRLSFVGIAIALVVTLCFAATNSAPPPPPPDRIGVSMVCLNIETGLPEKFKGEWDGTQSPWLYTYVEVHYRMAPDDGGWKPMKGQTFIVVIDIQRHVVKSIKIE